jgi:hypothetical protein
MFYIHIDRTLAAQGHFAEALENYLSGLTVEERPIGVDDSFQPLLAMTCGVSIFYIEACIDRSKRRQNFGRDGRL